MPDTPAFDPRSGNFLERLIFNHRIWVVLLSMAATACFALQLRALTVTASYEKTLPRGHPYIRNYLETRQQLRGLGNTVRIAVENPSGDIFDPAYLETLRQINDQVFKLPGVDRAWMKSIWTPVVRWTEVTEEGFVGGPVMPKDYDGSPKSIESLKLNIARAAVVGSLVANDFRSSMVVVPLLAADASGEAIDNHRFASALETIRQAYEAPAPDGVNQPSVRVHVVGFTKLIGDLIDGLQKLVGFFGVAAAIAAGVIFAYTRCLRSTSLLLACSVAAVTWQLGIITSLGYALDPFSMLVPFLVFVIGVSHGAQKMNGIMQDMAGGTHPWVAARHTFRRLFIPGLAALLADAVGFAALMVIDIPVIRELALSASVGVAVLVFTNLILLPVLLSYVGVSRKAASRSLRNADEENAGRGLGRLWRGLDGLTERRAATAVLAGAALLGVGSAIVGSRLQVGDLDAGAPELRADSRYNRDNAFIAAHYGISSDVFAVIVRSAPDECGLVENLVEADRLAWALAQLPGVQKVESLADTVRAYTSGSFEGNPKWFTISADQRLIDPHVANALQWNSELITSTCTDIPVLAFLADHKAATLDSLVQAVNAFAAVHDTPQRQFLLAAGNAGVDAATNIVVKQANMKMLLCVYAAIVAVCLVVFRSWRATVVAVVPLLLTSVLSEALMVGLGIGVKVSTLPVVALGVGAGVDYSLYLLSVQLAEQRAGASVAQAHRRSIQFGGKVVALVAITLAGGVVTWVWSPIKFQADMGTLLTFMLLWNMIGAMLLIPALSHFLLRDVGQRMPSAAIASGE